MPNNLKHAFQIHRHSAEKVRNIPFLLTFHEWLQIWTDSGHLLERGRGRGKYCMARFGDAGPYAVGNVQIILHTENTSEGHVDNISEQHKEAIRKANTGQKLTFVQRHKISIVHRGKPKSKEHVQAVRIAARRKREQRWQRIIGLGNRLSVFAHLSV